jgi:anti-sigma factor RsiW
LLASYVDNEADARDCDRVRRHVDSCACCRDALARERLAREAVRTHRAGLRVSAPDPLKARCASYAADVSSGSKREIPPSFLRRWVPVSVAATLLLTVGAVFGLGLNDRVQALAFQTTIDHVKCSRFNAGSAPADPVAAAQLWESKFGWPIRVPASTVSGLELRGVRRCAVTDGRVAHLMYSWLGEPLSVYVLPKQTLGEAAEFVRRFRHNSVMWSQNNRTYIIVTSRPRDPAFERVVAYVRASAY